MFNEIMEASSKIIHEKAHDHKVVLPSRTSFVSQETDKGELKFALTFSVEYPDKSSGKHCIRDEATIMLDQLTAEWIYKKFEDEFFNIKREKENKDQ